MAELDIGLHCCQPGCGQLDFLPICCQGCRRVYCRRHASLSVHACSLEFTNCLATAEPEPCPAEAASESRLQREASCIGCSRLIAAPIQCAICGGFVCVAHRFSDSHPCLGNSDSDSRAAEQPVKRAELSNELLEQLRRADSRNLAGSAGEEKNVGGQHRRPGRNERQLALMKLKLSAVGDKSVPQADRVYLMVQPDCQQQQQPQQPLAVFFSRHWPVGKATDSLAARLGVPPVRRQPKDERLSLLLPSDSDDDGPPAEVATQRRPRRLLLPGDTIATCLKRGDFSDGDRLLLTYCAAP